MPFESTDSMLSSSKGARTSTRVFDRDQIMAILWDDPIAAVCGTDVPAKLGRGDEYLDLQRLETGLQRAAHSMTPTGGELSRRAVHPRTWERLMAQLGGAQS
jgi:hypothetical protein